MSQSTSNAYAKKINDVCDYINENLRRDLSIDTLSQVANFSKYHFHRQFSAYTGVSVYKLILLQRLKHASYQLVLIKDYRVIDIAMEAGFENPESFSRAFKKTFGQTPTQFRKQPDWKEWHKRYQFQPMQSRANVSEKMDIQVIHFAEVKVAALEHRGDPELIYNSVDVFQQWRNESKLSPVANSGSYGIAYDDPSCTSPDDFRFDICGSVKEDIPDNALGISNKIIPAGRCALIQHVGNHSGMLKKIHYLYGEWLPDNNENLRDFPCFFRYIKLLPDVEEHNLVTDIYLPLQ